MGFNYIAMAAELQVNTIARPLREQNHGPGGTLNSRPILMTRSSAIISLFAEPSVSMRGPSSYMLSILTHAALVGGVYFGLTHLPRIKDPGLLKRFAVRQLDVHALDPNFPRLPAAAAGKIPYPGPYPDRQSPAAPPPELADAMHSFVGSAAGRQTIIQPEFQTHLSFAAQVPLPTIMIWTPALAPKKRIVAPKPDQPTAFNVTPSLDLPNQEVKLAEISLASMERSPRSDAAPATTTSPVESHSPKVAQTTPATISELLEPPAPTAVLSISDLRMPDGTLLLPPVNDIAPSTAPKSAGSASGAAASNPQSARDSSRGDEADNIAIDGRRLSTEHISLPRDGKFSVVVVGTSPTEQYPETVEIWANRVAYTAYLHVGLKKNWILQYSMTRAAEAADAGRVARLEAPWPYDIRRPNLLSRDLNADALMVHGVLNQAGRLESLAIAFPSGFRYASFVLYALRQWQFRPAQQNGHATSVEVLLIIPDEMEE